MELLRKALKQGLVAEDIPLYETMNAFGVTTHIACNLPGHILGFVYVSSNHNYHIVLNGNTSYETQRSVFLHELDHICQDLPKMPYIIGIDMMREKFEAG